MIDLIFSPNYLLSEALCPTDRYRQETNFCVCTSVNLNFSLAVWWNRCCTEEINWRFIVRGKGLAIICCSWSSVKLKLQVRPFSDAISLDSAMKLKLQAKLFFGTKSLHCQILLTKIQTKNGWSLNEVFSLDSGKIASGVRKGIITVG